MVKKKQFFLAYKNINQHQTAHNVIFQQQIKFHVKYCEWILSTYMLIAVDSLEEIKSAAKYTGFIITKKKPHVNATFLKRSEWAILKEKIDLMSIATTEKKKKKISFFLSNLVRCLNEK